MHAVLIITNIYLVITATHVLWRGRDKHNDTSRFSGHAADESSGSTGWFFLFSFSLYKNWALFKSDLLSHVSPVRARRTEPVNLYSTWGKKSNKICVSFEKWELHFWYIGLISFLYPNSRVSCFKDVHMWQTFLSSKLFYVLICASWTGVCLRYFSPPSSMLKNNSVWWSQCYILIFVFVILWHGLGRRAEE